MRCQEVRELFEASLEGKLSWKKRISLVKHLARCKECEEDFLLVKYSKSLIKEEPPAPPPPGLVEDILRNLPLSDLKKGILAVKKREKKKWGKSFWTGLSLSVACFVFLVLAFYHLQGRRNSALLTPPVLSDKAQINEIAEALRRKIESLERLPGQVTPNITQDNLNMMLVTWGNEHLQKGWEHMQRKDFDQAILEFQALRNSLKKKDLLFRYYIGNCLIKKGNYAQAREVLQGIMIDYPYREIKGDLERLVQLLNQEERREKK